MGRTEKIVRTRVAPVLRDEAALGLWAASYTWPELRSWATVWLPIGPQERATARKNRLDLLCSMEQGG